METVPGKGYRFADEGDGGAREAGDGPTVMLAVLPFLNLSADTDRDYVADGLTEDMIATLSQVDAAHLRVIGRTSAMAYKGHEEIAGDDRCRTEGAVPRRGFDPQ